MKVSEHFFIEEFVPPEIFKQFGSNSIWFIDPKIIKVAEFFRTFFKVPITINDWHTGGHYKESGYRTPDTTTGSKYSQHKRGSACDLKLPNFDYHELRKIIIANENTFLGAGVTTVESDTPTWLHVDCRYTGLNKILFVPYK
jgi:hypothetical protein